MNAVAMMVRNTFPNASILIPITMSTICHTSRTVCVATVEEINDKAGLAVPESVQVLTSTFTIQVMSLPISFVLQDCTHTKP